VSDGRICKNTSKNEERFNASRIELARS